MDSESSVSFRRFGETRSFCNLSKLTRVHLIAIAIVSVIVLSLIIGLVVHQNSQRSYSELNYEYELTRRLNGITLPKWVHFDSSNVSLDEAFIGGNDRNGSLYVCRAHLAYDNSIIPGSYSPSRKICSVPRWVTWNDARNDFTSFDLLIGDDSQFSWVESGFGNSVPGTIVGGISIDGKDLKIARVTRYFGKIIGKLEGQYSYTLTQGNEEEKSRNYQVLCLNDGVFRIE